MCNPIEISGHIYSQDENGNWTYKAKEPDALKADGTLKAKYKELPQFDIIYDIDNHFNKLMATEIKQFTKELKEILK